MASKDDRSKEKRQRMKQHASGHHQKHRNNPRTCTTNTTTTSNGNNNNTNNKNTSSNSPHGVHSIVDVADSSDEPRFARGKGWTSGVGVGGGGGGGGRRELQPQPNLQLYDMNHHDVNDDEDDLHDNKENSQLCAGNYQQMADNSSVGGNHFSFEDEKQWSSNDLQKGEEEQKVIDSNEYFTLNIKMLTAGLKTIPFYKRLDYSASLFTRNQINAMNSRAEIAERKFHQTYDINRPIIKVNSAKKDGGGGGGGGGANGQNERMEEVKDELDELLGITTPQTAANVKPTTPVSPSAGEQSTITNVDDKVTTGDNPDEVETWLNSVLDK